jgi:dolichol-phosphate mannosyltransferase
LSTSPAVSIIIPTLNEAENIRALISEVTSSADQKNISIEIIVVDDGSTDGTREIVRDMMDKFRVRLVARPTKKGITSAVLEGFEQSSASVMGVMDSDFSHPPEKVPELVEPIINGDLDMTIGSRYIEGGSTARWSLRRRLISKFASLLARPLTDVKDPMSGFFFIREDLIDPVSLNDKGWKICLEILVRAQPRRVKEIPIFFSDRVAGRSKMGIDIVWGFLLNILNLYIHSLRSNLS